MFTSCRLRNEQYVRESREQTFEPRLQGANDLLFAPRATVSYALAKIQQLLLSALVPLAAIVFLLTPISKAQGPVFGRDFPGQFALLSSQSVAVITGDPTQSPERFQTCSDPDTSVGVNLIRALGEGTFFMSRGLRQLGWMTCNPRYSFSPAGDIAYEKVVPGKSSALVETDIGDLVVLRAKTPVLRLWQRAEAQRLSAFALSRSESYAVIGYEQQDHSGAVEVRTILDGVLVSKTNLPVAPEEIQVADDGRVLAYLYSYKSGDIYNKSPAWILWGPSLKDPARITPDGDIEPWRANGYTGDAKHPFNSYLSHPGYGDSGSFSPDGNIIAVTNYPGGNALIITPEGKNGGYRSRKVPLPNGDEASHGHVWLTSTEFLIYSESNEIRYSKVSAVSGKYTTLQFNSRTAALLGHNRIEYSTFFSANQTGGIAVNVPVELTQYKVVELQTSRQRGKVVSCLDIGVEDSTPRPPQGWVLDEGRRFSLDDGLTLRVLNADSGTTEYETTAGLQLAPITPTRLVVFSDDKVALYDSNARLDGDAIATAAAPGTSGVWFPGQNGVAYLPREGSTGEIRVFDSNLAVVASLQMDKAVSRYLGLAVTRDGNALLFAEAWSKTDSGGNAQLTVILLKGNHLEMRQLLSGVPEDAQISNDVSRVAVLVYPQPSLNFPDVGAIHLWQIDASGTLKENSIKHADSVPRGESVDARTWALSLDGSLLAVRDQHGVVQVIDLSTSTVAATGPNIWIRFLTNEYLIGWSQDRGDEIVPLRDR